MQIKNADTEFIFDGLFYFAIGLIGFIIFIWTIWKDAKAYNAKRTVSSFLATSTGLFFIGLILWGNYFLNQRDKSPVVIQAGYDGGYNGCWFEFRADGTYKFANSGGLGVDYFRGTYRISDSIITIDKNNIDNVIESNRLVIRPVIQTYQQDAIDADDTSIVYALYQVDGSGKIVDPDFVFMINEDNRK